MKNYITLFCLSLIFFFCMPALSLGQEFEGTINFEVSDLTKQGMGEMPYMVKGNKARMEFGQGQQKAAMLFLPEESRVVIIMDAMKGYMSMETEEAKEMNEKSMKDMSDTEAEKTGETKTIADRECEVWKIESPEDTVEACMAKGMGNFMMPQNPVGQDNTPQWAQELMDQGAMPLEVVQFNDGSEAVQMRATSIKEESLSDDLFEIPEGYKDMSGMLKQQMQNRN